MRLMPVRSQHQLKHGTRVRLTLRRIEIRDAVICINPLYPFLIFVCQNEAEALDGGHRDEAELMGKRYAWALLRSPDVYAMSSLYQEGVRGLRIIEPQLPAPHERVPVETTIMPDGRTLTEREVTV